LLFVSALVITPWIVPSASITVPFPMYRPMWLCFPSLLVNTAVPGSISPPPLFRPFLIVPFCLQ
jgi:hypothetical protein